MKRNIAILLLIMMLICAGARAAEASAAFDKAFEADSLTLVKAPLPEVSAGALDLSDEIWAAMEITEPADPNEWLADALQSAQLTWVSLSPDGSGGLLRDRSVGFACRDGLIRPILPSSSRGVGDEYGDLAKYAARFTRLLGDESTVYSPDGRYAAVFNIQYTLIMGNYYLDPIVIDLSTGEMILTATYGSSYMDNKMGVATAAAFSADSRYLYYMLYGNVLIDDDGSGYRTGLYRYDLETQETELCHSWSDLTYYPGLSETAEGALIVLHDQMHLKEQTGISRVTRKDGVWTNTERMFDLPMSYWGVRYMLYSAASGYAVIPGVNTLLTGHYAFQCVRPDDGFAGMGRYLTVARGDGRIEARTAYDIWNMFAKAEESGVSLYEAYPIQAMLTVRLSPDGRYLLAHTLEKGEEQQKTFHLYLIRLDDLAVREAGGIDPGDILYGDPAQGRGFRQSIEWNCDTLLICTSEGIRAYRFAD
ncbi:MAG: hypothetical protein IJH78_07730 [Clostridia bacterium]|nr:hypothetical protein [Clostridia bacterium]